MQINTISKTNIILKLFPWTVVGVLSYFFNDQLTQHVNRIRSLETYISILTEKINQTLVALQKSVHINTVIVTSQNDMTKFYIKALGITAGVVVLLVIASNIYPTLFSAKVFLPSYFCTRLYKNT